MAEPFVWTVECRARQAVGVAFGLRHRLASYLAGNVSAPLGSPSKSASVLSSEFVRSAIPGFSGFAEYCDYLLWTFCQRLFCAVSKIAGPEHRTGFRSRTSSSGIGHLVIACHH